MIDFSLVKFFPKGRKGDPPMMHGGSPYAAWGDP